MEDLNKVHKSGESVLDEATAQLMSNPIYLLQLRYRQIQQQQEQAAAIAALQQQLSPLESQLMQQQQRLLQRIVNTHLEQLKPRLNQLQERLYTLSQSQQIEALAAKLEQFGQRLQSHQQLMQQEQGDLQQLEAHYRELACKLQEQGQPPSVNLLTTTDWITAQQQLTHHGERLTDLLTQIEELRQQVSVLDLIESSVEPLAVVEPAIPDSRLHRWGEQIKAAPRAALPPPEPVVAVKLLEPPIFEPTESHEVFEIEAIPEFVALSQNQTLKGLLYQQAESDAQFLEQTSRYIEHHILSLAQEELDADDTLVQQLHHKGYSKQAIADALARAWLHNQSRFSLPVLPIVEPSQNQRGDNGSRLYPLGSDPAAAADPLPQRPRRADRLSADLSAAVRGDRVYLSVALLRPARSPLSPISRALPPCLAVPLKREANSISSF